MRRQFNQPVGYLFWTNCHVFCEQTYNTDAVNEGKTAEKERISQCVVAFILPRVPHACQIHNCHKNNASEVLIGHL